MANYLTSLRLMYKTENNGTFHIRLLWGLNDFMLVRHAQECLEYNECSVSIVLLILLQQSSGGTVTVIAQVRKMGLRDLCKLSQHHQLFISMAYLTSQPCFNPCPRRGGNTGDKAGYARFRRHSPGSLSAPHHPHVLFKSGDVMARGRVSYSVSKRWNQEQTRPGSIQT